LILPAFTRSMKDPFTPCRLAALRAVIACKQYFSQKEVAESVLPCVIPHTLDGASEVRAEAFNVVDTFLVNLRAESKRMAKDEADRISAATCGIKAEGSSGAAGGTAVAPTSGSYLTGISSWMGSSTEPAASTSSAGGAQRMTSSSSNGISAKLAADKPSPVAPKFSSLTLSDAQVGGSSKYKTADDSGGWSDDDDDVVSPQNKSSGGCGWDDDDDDDALGMSPVNKTKGDDDFFSSFDSSKASKPGGGKVGSLGATKSGMMLKGKAKPAVTKLPASDLLDGWDDF